MRSSSHQWKPAVPVVNWLQYAMQKGERSKGIDFKVIEVQTVDADATVYDYK